MVLHLWHSMHVVIPCMARVPQDCPGGASCLWMDADRRHRGRENSQEKKTDLLPPPRDEFSWTAQISRQVKCGQSRQALKMYEEMREGGVKPSTYTFVAVLKACSRLQDLEIARQIHLHVVQSGLEADVFVATKLIDVYAKCGRLVEARTLFDKMPLRDVVSWTAMIWGYAQMEEGEKALQLYERMRQEGVVPDARTFVGALKACSYLSPSGYQGDGISGNIRCLEQVRAIHSDILRRGIELNVYVGSMLVDVYAKCGNLVDARQVFEKMPHRNVVCWTAMILGYAQMEDGGVALQLYREMKHEGLVPDDRAFVGALRACSSLAACKEGDIGGELLSKNRCLEQVRAIHSDILKSRSELPVFVGTMLVDVYAKCGSLVDARSVFESMPCRDVVSWNAMISGYAQMEEGEEALQLYARMQQEGVLPDDRTFVGALKACGSVAGLEKGKEIHAQIAQSGHDTTDIFVASTLIDMYGKCGSMVEAQQVFDAVPIRNIVTWGALIAGYARQGEHELVFDLFQQMIRGGVEPNGVTFLCVLTVCSHAGLVDSGQDYFEAMSRDFGITPNLEHYNCIIDLLGRAGQLEKAMAIANTVPFQPDGVLWETLLGACQKWKDVELGRRAFESAVRLNKYDAAAYVLMSNIYAGARMWDAAKEIQAMRLNIGARKEPGKSQWTDIRGVVHVFVAGDEEHPESQDIGSKLQSLYAQMKKAGYVPHLDSVLRDMPDDEKEKALCRHSEKLALSYALLKTPQGTTIRVVKNLRVCQDCHTAIALISKIEQRTIICRDASRFHVYKDGHCSCGDYW